MRSLTICTPCQALGTQVKEDLIGKACDMNGRQKKNAYMILVGKHNRKLMLGEYTERGFSKNRTGMMDWIYLAHDRD